MELEELLNKINIVKKNKDIEELIQEDNFVELIKDIFSIYDEMKEEDKNVLFEKLNEYGLKDLILNIISKKQIIVSKTINEIKNEMSLILRNIEEENLVNEESLSKLINDLLKDRKEVVEEVEILSKLLNKLQNSTKKEVVETIRIYFEIKKEIGEEDSLKEVLLEIRDTNSIDKLKKDINRFSLNELFPKNGKNYSLKGQTAGMPDIEFFYYKEGRLHSKSGSITLAGDSTFEGTQNNFHSSRTSLKRYILDNYTNQELNKKYFDIKKEKQIEQSSDVVSQIKELKKLFDEGVLSKEEFEKAKKKLLN